MVTSFYHYNDVTNRCAAVHFYLSHGLVPVCQIELSEIELSHMGKNNGNQNLVYEKKAVHTVCLLVQ